jgi:monofunctional biosynthetic peptidoglycan transglycosylase
MKNIFLIINVLTAYVLINNAPVYAEGMKMEGDGDSTKLVIDFKGAIEVKLWSAINDGVMGGLSEGNASFTENGNLLFSGNLSLENNGGFSSIRMIPADLDFGGCKGVRIKVKGDGRSYQFRLRTGRRFDGTAYKCDFSTIADKWIEINLYFDSFLPTYRGKIIKNAKPLDSAEIKQIGFLIADKSAGPFKLIVDRIEFF